MFAGGGTWRHAHNMAACNAILNKLITYKLTYKMAWNILFDYDMIIFIFPVYLNILYFIVII